MGQTIGIAILGTFWASRVAFYGGISQAADATRAPEWAQVLALRETFLVMAGLVTIGLLFALRAWRIENRAARRAGEPVGTAAR